MESVRVVASDSLDGVDLEAGGLELLHVPIERGGGIGAGENVTAHEEPPLCVLPVGALAQSSYLRCKMKQHVDEKITARRSQRHGESKRM